jgi:hypothetical protein
LVAVVALAAVEDGLTLSPCISAQGDQPVVVLLSTWHFDLPKVS